MSLRSTPSGSSSIGFAPMTSLFEVTGMNPAQSPPLPELVNTAAGQCDNDKQPSGTYQADKNNAHRFHDLHTFLR